MQLVKWFGTMENIWKRGAYVTVVDVRTGITMKMKRMGGTYHADVEPPPKNDTALLKKAYGGQVELGAPSGRGHREWQGPRGLHQWHAARFRYAAEQWMDGQVCIHFLGSKTHGGKVVDPEHQNCVQEAYNKGK